MILASSGGSGSAGGVAIERCTPAEIDPRRSTKPSAPVVIVHTHHRQVQPPSRRGLIWAGPRMSIALDPG